MQEPTPQASTPRCSRGPTSGDSSFNEYALTAVRDGD